MLFMSMEILISNADLGGLKSRDEVPLKCGQCGETFYAEKHFVIASLGPKRNHKFQFCGRECRQLHLTKSVSCKCHQCGDEIVRPPSWCKGKHTFCSCSCSAIWNNNHKTWGTRRSRLEMWIERKLSESYPNLHIDYNKTDAINAELDIYIPSLKLAFELNGIFHYEPIYGAEKLATIQTNDGRKFQACVERGVELCIVDTHNVKYLKAERDQKFLGIICSIIQKKQFLPL